MSKMTSRELVRRTLEFNSPERIPRDLWILPWAKKYHPVYTDIDFARPIALVFGSESEGISDQTLAYADKVVRIPMLGMVQSLNLSVSVAVMLYEALRQRTLKGYGVRSRLSAAEHERLQAKWLGLVGEPG